MRIFVYCNLPGCDGAPREGGHPIVAIGDDGSSPAHWHVFLPRHDSLEAVRPATDAAARAWTNAGRTGLEVEWVDDPAADPRVQGVLLRNEAEAHGVADEVGKRAAQRYAERGGVLAELRAFTVELDHAQLVELLYYALEVQLVPEVDGPALPRSVELAALAAQLNGQFGSLAVRRRVAARLDVLAKGGT